MMAALDSGAGPSESHQRQIMKENPVQVSSPQAELLAWEYPIWTLVISSLEEAVGL
jgi:hypothetical protein